MNKASNIEYLSLQEEYSRRLKEDPLKNYILHAKQKAFINSILKTQSYESWFIASNRSGKSDAGAYLGSSLARFGEPDTHKPTTGWVVSLDYGIGRDIIQPKYFNNGFVPPNQSHPPFIPKREIKEWRVADQVLKLKNGSIIGFKSQDSGQRKFQGADKDWIHFDEEPDEGVYNEAILRIGAGKKLRIFGTCTLLPPDNAIGGVSWIMKRIIKSNNPNIQVFGASIFDNPHLDPAEIQRLVAKYPLHTPMGKIRLLGEYLTSITGALVYYNYDTSLHKKLQDEVYLRKPLCLFIDFNVEPMVMGVGQKVNDTFKVYREIVLEVGSIPQVAEIFKQMYPSHNAEVYLYGDASGKGRTAQTGLDDYQTFLNCMRNYPAPIVLKIPEKNPQVNERINAVNYALKDEYGNINLEIDPSCVELIEDFELVVRDVRGGIKKSHNRKDAYYKRTHISDALGYWIAYDLVEKPIEITNYTLLGKSVIIPKPMYKC